MKKYRYKSQCFYSYFCNSTTKKRLSVNKHCRR